MKKILNESKNWFYVILFLGVINWSTAFFEFGEYNIKKQFECYRTELLFKNLEDTISDLDGIKGFSKNERHYLDSLAEVLDKGEKYNYSFNDKLIALKNYDFIKE